ncbi:metallophosphoesterase [Blautia sp. MSK17_66]|uniref:metallophosphoesterase n=1 Tax=Blautia TaxID=572511 RepID=UPI001570EA76|nr:MULTISPECIES: metallophosphoesterase [Blautia]MCB5551228.1 metallophosphoesterase [Blautia sp. MSK17_66]NSK02717.1 metallophosphoesterase [Blautia obeum]
MLAIFLAPIYILLNIYVLRWGYLWIGNCHHLFQSRIFRIILTVIYTLIALTPLTGFLIRKPAFLHRILKITSNYFLGIFMYILMVLFSIDVVRLILKYAVHASWIQSRIVFAAVGACCICIVIIISFSGIYHAKHIKVTPYKITVDKSAPDMDSLKIVLLADTHFGYNSGAVHAQEIVDKINEQQPDLVCIAGDIFDNEYDAVREPEKISEILRTIRSKYGVYACWGNHDLNEPILAGFTFKHKKEDSKQLKDPRMKLFLQNSNIQLLEDEAVLIDNSFYVVGRKDASLIEKIEEKRKTPAQLTQKLDKDKTIIVIDHQPKELQDIADAGVDLDLCGHTHDGQTFPGNFTVKFLWENPCGYLQKGYMHNIVTSGSGVWGPAMRVGTDSEICTINLTFSNS